MSSTDKGNRLKEVASSKSTGDEVSETVRLHEKIIELARESEKGQWEELFSEELNKPSIQL